MMNLVKSIMSGLLVTFALSGCGGGDSGDSTTTTATTNTNTGLFLDAPVSGVEFESNSYSGKTDAQGLFKYKDGEETTFKINQIILGSVVPSKDGRIVTPLELFATQDVNDTRVVNTLIVLQSLDSDGNTSNGITIEDAKLQELRTLIDLSTTDVKLTKSELASLLNIAETEVKDEVEAVSEFEKELEKKSEYETELEEQEYDDEYSGTTIPTVTSGGYTLLAWNDLGMHCFDGSDFSVFSILPPFNTLNAQLILKDGTNNKHVVSGVTLTYESYEYMGHINTTSANKTNFWDYLPQLFPGATSTPNVGLTGNKAPSLTPQMMSFNTQENWFEATGIPVVNRDDDNTTNYYPMVKVVATDNSTGAVLATAKVVLPVSDEMDCAACHSSIGGSSEAKPIIGWVNNPDFLKDYKLNILRLHDERMPTAVLDNNLSLAQKGFTYKVTLEETALSGTPVLCASCHSSNALPGTGVVGVKPLTQAIHGYHAKVGDLNSVANRDSCYSCHPGSKTQCLRGAMGAAKDANGNNTMQCQSCHGDLNSVGSASREGWLDQPNCQACHQDGKRYTSAIDSLTGVLRTALNGDNRFATNPDTPLVGKSLYRYSTGHGDLQCSACHGSTHAIFPTSHAQDNVLSTELQGHSGTIAECTACHTTMPDTTNEGPHGMHSIGAQWVHDHGKIAENSSVSCTFCHGADYRGTYLSKTFSARTFDTGDFGVKSFDKGQAVSCYDCHNGPNGN